MICLLLSSDLPFRAAKFKAIDDLEPHQAISGYRSGVKGLKHKPSRSLLNPANLLGSKTAQVVTSLHQIVHHGYV